MKNLIISFNVVLPLVLMMLLGYVLRITKLLDDVTMKKMNKVIFRAFFPPMIFYNVYSSDISNIINPKFIIYSACIVLVVFILALILIPLFIKNNLKRGALIQGIFRGNFVIFGVPVATALYGDKAAAIAAFAITIVIPIYNVLAVLTLEFFRGGKFNLKKILLNIITNPLIIGSFFGILFLITGIKLPSTIESVVKDIGKTATPLALIILGGTINLTSIKNNIKELIIGLSGKLIICPLIGISGAVFLGFRNAELSVLLSALASPAAVSSMTMAQEMGSDGELAGELVMCGTVFSIITIFLWTFVLKQLGYM